VKTHSIIVLFLTLLPIIADGNDDKYNRATVRDIAAFGVVIEDPGPVAANDGLSKEQLRTEVEQRLRKAGIQIDNEDVLKPAIYVRVQLLKSDSGFYNYAVEVGVLQSVTVNRNQVKILALTWSVNGIGTVGRIQMSRAVREDVAGFVDQFINAFLSVNPHN
jgi:hypothetical protein